jgi:hypothetical protein
MKFLILLYSYIGPRTYYMFYKSRTALGPTQPPIQCVRGVLSLGVRRPGREADHSPPSSDEVKNAWSYISTPQYAFVGWCLVKHRYIFIFYMIYNTMMCSSHHVNQNSTVYKIIGTVGLHFCHSPFRQFKKKDFVYLCNNFGS